MYACIVPTQGKVYTHSTTAVAATGPKTFTYDLSELEADMYDWVLHGFGFFFSLNGASGTTTLLIEVLTGSTVIYTGETFTTSASTLLNVLPTTLVALALRIHGDATSRPLLRFTVSCAAGAVWKVSGSFTVESVENAAGCVCRYKALTPTAT